MRRDRVRSLLESVADGSVAVDAALNSLALEPVESLGFATIDHHRALRQGFPEVIYGAGKTPQQIADIAAHIAARGAGVLVTRLSPDAAEYLRAQFPGAELNAVARTAYLSGAAPPHRGEGNVVV